MKMQYRLALVATLAALSATASAADGEINFIGAVTANTCTVTPGIGGAAATVNLPRVNNTAFTGAGSITGRTLFNINVSNCPGGVTNARAFFEANGENVDYATNSLKNKSGTASNVGFALFDGAQGARINIGQSTATQGTTPVALTAGAATLRYEVAYIQPTAAAVTAGTAVGQVQFSVDYP
jgi:major type 1 subunit fimbrin (pilin)